MSEDKPKPAPDPAPTPAQQLADREKAARDAAYAAWIAANADKFDDMDCRPGLSPAGGKRGA